MSVLSRAIKDNVPIIDYAEELGYHVKRVGRVEYTLEEHDSVRINAERNIFIRNSTNEGGSVIDFAMFALRIDEEAAIKQLRKKLNSEQIKNQTSFKMPEPKVEIPIVIPKKNSNYKRLFAFLCKTRCIDGDVVSDLIHRQMLFEDADHNNIVWIGYDYDGKAKFGCKRITLDKDNIPKFILKDVTKKDIRSGIFLEKNTAKKLFIINSSISMNVFEGITNKHAIEAVVLGFDDTENSKNNKKASLKVLETTGFSGQVLHVDINFWREQSNIADNYKLVSEPFIRGDLTGSKKHIGMFVDNKATDLFITEAPIDAMSLMTLFKLHNRDYNSHNYLAQAGTNGISSLIYHIQHQPRINKIYLCYDNDEAGKKAIITARNELSKVGYKGEIINKIPTENDWNDYLKKFVREKYLAKEKNNQKIKEIKPIWEISY